MLILKIIQFSLDNIKLSLLAPKGAKLIKNSWGTVAIKSSNNSFQIELATTTNKNVISEIKQGITSNDINIFKRYLINTPDSILYESNPGMNISEFHIYHYKNLGNIAVTCENVKGDSFSESEARLMLKSCQSINKKK